MIDWHILDTILWSLTSRKDKDLRTISSGLSLSESLTSLCSTEEFSHVQQNSADQSSSFNKRLRLTIEEKSKDVKNAESFEEINTDFDVFERNKRLDLDEEVDEEDLCTEDISTIEDQ